LVDTRGFKDFARESTELRQSRRTTPEKTTPTHKVPKTIVANAPAEGADHVGNHVEFHTSVDKLMKIIQAMPETENLVETIESVVKQEPAPVEEPEKAGSQDRGDGRWLLWGPRLTNSPSRPSHPPPMIRGFPATSGPRESSPATSAAARRSSLRRPSSPLMSDPTLARGHM
jgi:hypothetical protein